MNKYPSLFIGFLMHGGYKMAALNRLAVLLLFIWSLVWSQVGNTGAEIGPDGIRITAEVAPHNVPLNRTARLTVRLEWAGDLDRYEIKRFDNPLMENFSILSTSGANRVQVVGGQPVAIQEYYFMLKPDVLGMAYVDGMVVRYTDIATGKEYRLFANRLEAKGRLFPPRCRRQRSFLASAAT
jgi:hypothetical protein